MRRREPVCTRDGAPDDGTSHVLLMPGLVYIMVEAPMIMCLGWQRFHDVVNIVEQPLWNSCTESQLASVAESEMRLHGMKSHNCHVLMLKFIPTALHEMLPRPVWSPMTECHDHLVQPREFPPAFFNSMELLIVHLPYEAHVGDPAQYRWMYPFERFLRDLKMKVKNKAHIEASILVAYLVEEIGLFTSDYFAL
ncbi:hypothetical protein Sango_0653100 [Sesamum angolense]|uniref:DUF4218 domain-containing protein n=1 Tax=Sesamum angolense TaxID=2727404 RepID=A0AAE1X777_9LAMI|nr:hypothetical protein Sango_0653100 [Sesamum angolense]